jgi:hypothetical protein
MLYPGNKNNGREQADDLLLRYLKVVRILVEYSHFVKSF